MTELKISIGPQIEPCNRSNQAVTPVDYVGAFDLRSKGVILCISSLEGRILRSHQLAGGGGISIHVHLMEQTARTADW